ncbi:hypothetical protein SAMN04488007_3898 [Maribacter aquivivus]|uniref:Uncharacterized protein n=1 Tax=Maribacter aquivivus TaxID=228958 RepID=A0A1M6VIF8_9FLAO|nr:hypothetical protein [Maribacter aquivivus]SHK81124.1 hypothetical protein SAMN04488007_3898 [Maribacter aquivivus]
MLKQINIHNKGEVVILTVGDCKVDIIGGFYVQLGDFLIMLKNLKTLEIKKFRRVCIKVKSWHLFNQRSIRIFNIDIMEPGEYLIEFIKPEQVLIKRSRLPILNLLKEPINNKNLEIGLIN